ncbi:hypothetical protein AN1V17_11520 [Vallitalea sediminicola]
MLKEAISKLKQEIETNPKNAYIKYVGDYLVDYIKKNSQHAENIMRKENSITGSLEHMKKEAQKKAENGIAMLTPEEGFKAVLDYYKINEPPVLKVVSIQKKINISLDDLL